MKYLIPLVILFTIVHGDIRRLLQIDCSTHCSKDTTPVEVYCTDQNIYACETCAGSAGQTNCAVTCTPTSGGGVSDCPDAGQTCTDTGTVASGNKVATCTTTQSGGCTIDDDCDKSLGETCNDAGACVINSGGCTTDADCASGKTFCRDVMITNKDGTSTCGDTKECVSYAGDGDSCGGFTLPCYQEQCSPDLVCIDSTPGIADDPGTCGTGCNTVADCATGEICTANECATGCNTDDDCESGKTWCRAVRNDNGCSTEKECVPYVGKGKNCGGFTMECDQEQCIPPFKCIDMNQQMADEFGMCGDECTTIDDCATGEICNFDGGCVSDTSPECTEDSDCGIGQTCTDAGECEVVSSGCTTDADCVSGKTFCRDVMITNKDGTSTCGDTKECVSYAGEGDTCGGFTLTCYQEQCSPDLVCAGDGLASDLPGKCEATSGCNLDCVPCTVSGVQFGKVCPGISTCARRECPTCETDAIRRPDCKEDDAPSKQGSISFKIDAGVCIVDQRDTWSDICGYAKQTIRKIIKTKTDNECAITLDNYFCTENVVTGLTDRGKAWLDDGEIVTIGDSTTVNTCASDGDCEDDELCRSRDCKPGTINDAVECKGICAKNPGFGCDETCDANDKNFGITTGMKLSCVADDFEDLKQLYEDLIALGESFDIQCAENMLANSIVGDNKCGTQGLGTVDINNVELTLTDSDGTVVDSITYNKGDAIGYSVLSVIGVVLVAFSWM